MPRSAGREPGLLLVAVDGQVRFWDNVAASLVGEERSHHLSVVLGAGETVVSLARCDPSNFVIGTSQNRLFRVGVASSGGRLQAQISPFQLNRGIFGRLFGGAASASSSLFTLGSEGFVALAPGPAIAGQGMRHLYACGQRLIQIWRISDGGGERLLGEQDIASIVTSFEESQLAPLNQSSAHVDQDVGFTLVDVTARDDGTLAVLYCYAEQPNKPLTYGIAILAPSSDHASFSVSRKQELQYKALRDPRPYSSPRLILPNGDRAAFVAFPDVMVVILVASGPEEALGSHVGYEEEIALKDSVRDRFFGFGSENADIAPSDTSVAAVSCLSAMSGPLLIELSYPATEAYLANLSSPSQRQSARNDRLQVRLEQAVFFDTNQNNPLSFAITQRQAADGDLALCAENISSAIVTSSSTYLHQFADVRSQLADRLAHLKALIETIKNNDLLARLPLRSRGKLRADAELTAASSELWRHYNQVIDRPQSAASGASRLLSDAIEDVMAGLGLGYGQDAVRLFFRTQSPHLAMVFDRLYAQLKAAETKGTGAKSADVAELNRIAIAAFQSAWRYRSSPAAVASYGLTDQKDRPVSDFEAWTCRPGSLQLLEALFHSTEALIRERRTELGAIVDLQDQPDSGLAEAGLQAELKAQLCELSRYTLAAYEERLSFLSGKGPSSEKEHKACLGKYRSARPKLVHPLVAIGRADRAFSLAERHADFETLTQLCLDPATGDPQPQILHYLRRYRQEFAFELYHYWIDHGRTAELLEHGASNAEWGQLLKEFLQDATADGHARLAWLHDITLQRYQSASATLLIEASREVPSLKSKNVMLSLGKLAYLANMDDNALANPSEQRRIELVDDQLDLISVHHKLAELFQVVLQSASFAERRNASSQGEAGSMGILGHRLLVTLHEQGQEAFVRHYLRQSEHLLDGEVLRSEDLIDLLTMKDRHSQAEGVEQGDNADDFVTALDVAVRAKEAEGLQSARIEAIVAAVWRRALLRDDWQNGIAQTSGTSDEEMARRLRATAWYQLAVASFALDATSDGDATGVLSNPDVTSLLSEIARYPASDVIKARFQARRGQTDGNLDDSMDEAAGPTGVAHHAQTFLDDLSHEVDRVQALLGGIYRDDGVGEHEEGPALSWIKEAYRLAGEEARYGAAGAYDETSMR